MTWLNGLEHVVREAEPLAPWNWFRLGGPAQYFAEPTSVDELAELVRRCQGEGLPLRLLGGGSSILVSDEGITGVVIHLGAPAFCEIRPGAGEIAAGGGAKLNHLVATAAREGLAGLEALVGIPGTVGGAVSGNAIGHGASIGQWTDRAQVMTRAGEVHNLSRRELRFGYRESNLDDLIVLEATFSLESGDASQLTRRMQQLWIVKRSSQPAGELGHGRIFADPRGMTAAEIIEQAGLKGASVGGALVSDRNANFIEAQPGTTAKDVRALMDLVRAQVSEKLGVDLMPDIEIW